MDSSVSILYDLLKNISTQSGDDTEIQKFIIDINQLESPHTSIVFQLMIYDNYVNNNFDFENITSKCVYDFVNNEGSKGIKINVENIPKYMMKMIQLYIDITKSK